MPQQQYQPIQPQIPSYQTIGQNQQEYVNMNADADFSDDFDDESFDEDDFDEGTEDEDNMEGFGSYGAMPAATYLPAAAVAGAVYMVTVPSAKTKKAATAALFTSLGVGALFWLATSRQKATTAGW